MRMGPFFDRPSDAEAKYIGEQLSRARDLVAAFAAPSEYGGPSLEKLDRAFEHYLARG